MRSIILAATLAALMSACTATVRPTAKSSSPTMSVGTTMAAHPEWSKNAVMYEVNIRQYTPAGTFSAFSKELPRLKALGVDVLWIMPVQPIGVSNRKGTRGSPYSIADYTATNSELGTVADFKAMVAAAHAQGLRVILDWVANHTAHDHPWTVTHKDWHTRHADGTLSRPVDPDGKETDWSDVADLNYNNADMRAAMISAMRWWVDSTGIDGFRCDVAGFVPKSFWTEASATLRAVRPDLFLLAEWEDPELHKSFNATYGWELFHLMNDVAKTTKGALELDAYFAKQDTLFDSAAYRLYFTSNHDENSWNGTEFERLGKNHQAAFVLNATVRNSMPLLYSGQEASFNRRLPFFEKDSIDWNGPSLADFYRAIFELRHTNDVLWNGNFGAPQTRLVTTGGNSVYAFSRARGNKAVLVVTNFADTAAVISYSAFAQPGAYVDWFSKAPTPLAGAGTIAVPANGYRVLVK